MSQTTTTSSKSKSKSKSKQKVGPYKPTQKVLDKSIAAAGKIPVKTTATPEQQWALEGLNKTAKTAADQFNPQQQELINNLYQGNGVGQGADDIRSAYGGASGAYNRYLGQDYLDPNSNPYLHPALQNLQNDIYNQVGDKFALAGRSFSGDMADSLGRGYAAGVTPLLLNQYNQNVSAQQNAAQGLSDAANQQARGLDSTYLNKTNVQGSAAGAQGALYQPYQAQLGASQAAAQAPYTDLYAQNQYLLPVAQLGSTSKGKTNTTTTSTGTQTSPSPSPLQTIAGLASGGIGLLGGTGAFGGGGWLTNAFS